MPWGHFHGWKRSAGPVLPVLITASPELLAQRLAARSREDVVARGNRLQREAQFVVNGPAVIEIDNSGLPERAIAAFLELVRHQVEIQVTSADCPLGGQI